MDEEVESKNLKHKKKRGSFEGAIRIPVHSSSFLFNDLVFLRIPRKSLKFLTLLFSIRTAPTNISFITNSLREAEGALRGSGLVLECAKKIYPPGLCALRRFELQK